MKNLKKLIITIVFLIVAVFSATNISFEKVNADTQYTVYFNFDQNSASIQSLPEALKSKYSGIKSQKVSAGGYAVEPISDKSIFDYYHLDWQIVVNADLHKSVDVSNYPIQENNTTFIAVWTPVEYNVYYTYPDGEDAEITNCKYSETFTYDSPQLELYRPTRPNYVFVNWYRNSDLTGLCLNISSKTRGNVILYPKWEPQTYNVTYHDAGDNLYNITSYNIETEDFVLKAPSKAGHIFLGWYLDEEMTHECTKITSQMTGNIDLYAKWEVIVYDVTYILPNGDFEIVKCEYGQTAELPKIEKSIFEIVKSNVSRENITGDTIIILTKTNIWYVYFIGLIVVLAGLGVALFVIIKRRRQIKKLRYMYQSNYKKI